ncbi:MAG: nitrous oxide reductase family maturation protein NosD [Pseudomonadota bacterium]
MTVALALAPAFPAHAATIEVAPGGLAAALAAAAPGDTLALKPGTYHGGIVIDMPMTVDGGGAAVVDAGGRGSVVRVTAADVILRGLVVRGSGSDLHAMDSGVFLDRGADRAVVEGNRIEGNLFGVQVHGPKDAVVRGNTILGRRDARMSERGNGVSLWNSPGSRVEDNLIRWGRDGIFTNASRNNVFAGNHFRDLRFAVHYMWTNDSRVADNVSEGNHVGYALMYSRRIEATGNLSRGDRDHGLLMNYTFNSTVTGNAVADGGGKCAFLYNANDNRFSGNWFQSCDIGIHFTAGSEGNAITGNAFVANRTQVKYVGSRHLDWADEGVGNYWSDNAAFDLDGDGLADAAYRPNDLMDRVVWRHPLAKLLLASPAVGLVRWAQDSFPAVLPGGVVDTAPLMAPPRVGALAR